MRNTRLEVSCCKDQETILTRAAKVKGLSVSDFILMTAIKEAEKISCYDSDLPLWMIDYM